MQIKKIIKIGISALKNMVQVLVCVFTIAPMMTIALVIVYSNTKIKLKIALVRFYIFFGYINVGDGYWRRNVLVTILRCW